MGTLMIVTFYIMGISHVLIIYIMTFWVKQMIVKDRKHVSSLKKRTSEKKNEYLGLHDILEHGFGYELFMEHLSNEFSIENLLSLTEFLQFKMKLIKETELPDQKLVINL